MGSPPARLILLNRPPSDGEPKCTALAGRQPFTMATLKRDRRFFRDCLWGKLRRNTGALFLTVLTACGPVPGYSDQGESGKLRKIQLQSSQEDLPHTGLVTGSGSIAVYGVGDTLEAFLLDGEGILSAPYYDEGQVQPVEHQQSDSL